MFERQRNIVFGLAYAAWVNGDFVPFSGYEHSTLAYTVKVPTGAMVWDGGALLPNTDMYAVMQPDKKGMDVYILSSGKLVETRFYPI